MGKGYISIYFIFQRQLLNASQPKRERESILTRSGNTVKDTKQLTVRQSSNVNRLQQLEEIRIELFQAVEDNDKAKVRIIETLPQ